MSNTFHLGFFTAVGMPTTSQRPMLLVYQLSFIYSDENDRLVDYPIRQGTAWILLRAITIVGREGSEWKRNLWNENPAHFPPLKEVCPQMFPCLGETLTEAKDLSHWGAWHPHFIIIRLLDSVPGKIPLIRLALLAELSYLLFIYWLRNQQSPN